MDGGSPAYALGGSRARLLSRFDNDSAETDKLVHGSGYYITIYSFTFRAEMPPSPPSHDPLIDHLSRRPRHRCCHHIRRRRCWVDVHVQAQKGRQEAKECRLGEGPFVALPTVIARI